jgi:hypothetical protein
MPSTNIQHDLYWRDSGFQGRIVRTSLRTLQFVFALIACGLYAPDLKASTLNSPTADSSWVYAEVVAGLAIITCIVHCFITVKRVLWTLWDGVIFVLWLASFGRFASLYLGAANISLNAKLTRSVPRMQAAIWIELVNVLLWFATLLHAIAFCCATRKVIRNIDKVAAAEEGRMKESVVGTVVTSGNQDVGQQGTSGNDDMFGAFADEKALLEHGLSRPPSYVPMACSNEEKQKVSSEFGSL